MKRLWLCLIGFAASCYSPDLTGVRYTCDTANPYCPDGLTCVGGICQLPGGDSGDGGIGPAPDGGAAISGCRSGTGTKVGTAFACPGRFNNNVFDSVPTASQRCADGYKLCTDSVGIDLSACQNLSGFFASQVPVHRENQTMLVCGAASGNQSRLFAGCGRATNTVLSLSPACTGFDQALDCSDPQWTCDRNSLDNTSQKNDFDGVLCCPQ